MTRRQSNSQLSGGIAAHPAPPPKIPRAKSAGEVLASILGSRRHPPRWVSSKGPNYQRGVLLVFAGAIEVHFEGKTHAAGKSPRGCCSCTTMPWLTGHMQPRRNWPTWASNVLINHPILRIWPRLTTTCSLDWKRNWMVAIFRLTCRSFLSRWPGWTDIMNFLEWLAKVRATG